MFINYYCCVVVELPQMPENDLRGARGVRGKRTSVVDCELCCVSDG